MSYLTLSGVLRLKGAIITSVFREQGQYWSSGWHNGVDIAAPVGTIVRAANDGIVANADTLAHKDGFGNRVVILHDDGKATLYAHFCQAPFVKKGQRVKKGAAIGKVGGTGNYQESYGYHLHLSVIDEWEKCPSIYYDGKLLDPIRVLGRGTCEFSTTKWKIVENGQTKYIDDIRDYYRPVKITIPLNNTIKVGSKVRVKQGAKTYNGGYLAEFVYDRVHDVIELVRDRAVIAYSGKVVAAVKLSDLTIYRET